MKWEDTKVAIIAALKGYGYTENPVTKGLFQKSDGLDGVMVATVWLKTQPIQGESIPVRFINSMDLDAGPSDRDINGILESTKQLIRTAINNMGEKNKETENTKPKEKQNEPHAEPLTDTPNNNTIVVSAPETKPGTDELTIDIIQTYINPLATLEEAMFFLKLCQSQGLNPFIGEAYLIKYGEKKASYVVGKDAHLRRAEEQTSFDGFKAGIIILNSKGTTEEREGTFYLKENENLVGGWAEVSRKDLELHFVSKVTFDEYVGRKSNGQPNKMWSTKPATMIRKVALVQALRETYVGILGGMYDISEMTDIGEVEVVE